MTEYETVFCIIANCAECGKPIYQDDDYCEPGIDKVHSKCFENYQRRILISRRSSGEFSESNNRCNEIC